MTSPQSESSQELAVVDAELLSELPTFELFFKTFGFKRMHGRVWGLLVLADSALSSKEIAALLGISAGATSTTLNELGEWGAVTSTFDSKRRCHLHSPVGNALSIVATVFRRREQVVFEQFRLTAERSVRFIASRHGERDPRVVTLRSILATCDIAEALMQLVFSAVQSAMNDSESVLSRALNAALKVGVAAPARWLFGAELEEARKLGEAADAAQADASLMPQPPPSASAPADNGAAPAAETLKPVKVGEQGDA